MASARRPRPPLLSEPRHVVAALRLLVFASLAVLGWSAAPSERFLFWSLTVVYGLTILGCLAGPNGDLALRRVRMGLFLFDTLIVAALIVLRGHDVQALVMAYFSLVLLAGLLAGVGNALASGIVVSLLFTVVTAWGRPPEEILTLRQAGTYAFFFVIAVFMGHVADEARDRERGVGGTPQGLGGSMARLRAMRDGQRAEERLQTTGVLCAGIAHELERPIAALLAGAADGPQRLAALEVAAREGRSVALHAAEVRATWEESADAARRLGQVAAALLEVGRSGSPERRVVEPFRALAALEDMLRSDLPDGVRLEVRCETTQDVRADPGRLKHLLGVLGENAIDAVAHGAGTFVRLRAEDAGADRVAFVVEDDGSGMLPEVRDRMYDPFFTTKGPGEGTGLGLFIARESARALGGTIDCTSAPGKGTRFVVLLPAALAARGAA